jgi:BirA family transcriptional regulator, biotin operon repressor / biotin---[acetyl-CoA-carboxylase] ligase
MPESGAGTSVPSPGCVGSFVGWALTWRTLVPVNAAPPRAPLDQVALQAVAGPQWQVRLYAEAGSTNALAAADPVRHRIVVADHQQAGRGRLDRAWVTPPGAALTFSAVFDPVVDVEWWPVLPLVAGYAVARALGDFARLKWPNDVMVEDARPGSGSGSGSGSDRKVCGILVERVNSRPPMVVIGIGINVDQTEDELPVPTATSLALAGHPVERTALFGAVVRSLRVELGEFARHPQTFVHRYRGRSATLDRDVRVELPGDRTVEGRVHDFDGHGRMLLETPEGLRTLSAGDVVHVRAPG